MTTRPTEAAERLRRRRNGEPPIAVYGKPPECVVIDPATWRWQEEVSDMGALADWALPLLDPDLASSPEKLEALGFNVRTAPHGWSASRDIGKLTVSVYESGQWFLTGDDMGAVLPLMPTLGQLRLLLAALEGHAVP